MHDTIGFFVNRKDYYFDLDAVRIPYDAATKKARSRSIFIGAKWLEVGYNPKDLWSVSRLHREHPERADHPTQKPLEIIERMIKASCPPGGVVLDPFMGSGTTAIAARGLGRQYTGFELNPEYCAIIAAAPGRAGAEPHHQTTQEHRARSQGCDPRRQRHRGTSMSFIDNLIANVIREDIRANSAYIVPDASGFIKLDAMENPYELPRALREELGRAWPTRC